MNLSLAVQQLIGWTATELIKSSSLAVKPT